jgi:hypothetical protein
VESDGFGNTGRGTETTGWVIETLQAGFYTFVDYSNKRGLDEVERGQE